MNGKLIYFPRIENIRSAEDCAKNAQGTYVLFGEYGLSPFALRIDDSFTPRPLCEILLSNKNRGLFIATLLSAHASLFSGAVIASGKFEKKDNMPMPVFDLDAAQALAIAVDLKKNGTLPQNFLIGVRAASGSEPAELRARHYLDCGADFIVLSNKKRIPSIESRIMVCEEVAAQ